MTNIRFYFLLLFLFIAFELAEVAVEEVDDDAIVGFALFSGRGRKTVTTQRKIYARFNVSWNWKTALQ